MALPKLFQRIFWHNNTTPAINEDNLNAMSKAIDDIDDRVIEREGIIMEAVAQATNAANDAADSAEAAAQSATSASNSASRAEHQADLAAQSATDAAASALAASGSAENAADSAAEAKEYRDEAEAITQPTTFWVDFTTGLLMYTNEDIFNFHINQSTGNLEWEAAT